MNYEVWILGTLFSANEPYTKTIKSAFKLFHKHIESCNHKCGFFTGANTIWVVPNNRRVIDNINVLKKEIKLILLPPLIFLLSTMFWRILHKLNDFCFDGEEYKFITFSVSEFIACWYKEPTDYKICFNKRKMKNTFSYLLPICPFTNDLKDFSQIIGIAMVSEPAPFFPILFLYYSEYKCMNSFKKI